jgi:aryl-alcohol dehydrogenase-like predicted oxidoreductase
MGEAASSQLSDVRLAKVAALEALAQGEGHTVLELSIAWLLSRPSVASVIAGATKPEQIAANVAAGGWKPSSEILAQVDVIAPR